MEKKLLLLFAILFQLVSCKHNYASDVSSMKKNFEENDAYFMELVAIFNKAINSESPDRYNYIINVIGDNIELTKTSKIIENGQQETFSGCSGDSDLEMYNILLSELGFTKDSIINLKELLDKINCTTVKTVDYKYFNIEVYNNAAPQYSYLHLKPGVNLKDIATISNAGIGAQFAISVTSVL